MRSIFYSHIALVCLTGCVLWSGCSEPLRSGAGGGTIETAEYVSDHYCVRVVGAGMGSDRGKQLAQHTALMMETMFTIYAAQDELPLPPGNAMPFHLHLDRQEYDRQAAIYGFPPGATNGFCNTSGEVHVYYKKNGQLPPEATAMHEGFHQYCHRALHFPTPTEVFQRVPGYKVGKLPTVPLWLNEGMAMNMESGDIQKDHNGIAVAINNVGAVNRERLNQLAAIIRSGRCPSIRAIMNKIMGDQITIDDYAVMWGIVFDLRMATGNAIFVREQKEIERAGPDAVRAAMDAAIDPMRQFPYMRWPVPVTGRFLRACRVVWGLDVPNLIDTCATGALEPRDFDRQWNRRLTQAALAEVEKLLMDQGETLDQWEQGWKKRMLALHAQVRGGTYVYIEPATIQSTCSPGNRSSLPGAW